MSSSSQKSPVSEPWLCYLPDIGWHVLWNTVLKCIPASPLRAASTFHSVFRSCRWPLWALGNVIQVHLGWSFVLCRCSSPSPSPLPGEHPKCSVFGCCLVLITQEDGEASATGPLLLFLSSRTWLFLTMSRRKPETHLSSLLMWIGCNILI